MNNDIAIHNPSTAVEMNVSERQHYASVLADANMIPKAFQKSPANIFVAIEYGNALGIAPIVALNEINVINGTPSLSASMMSSLARSAGHRVRTQNTEDGAAVCEIIRADDPEFTHRSTWDQKKAQDAGLWGKGHWAKDPATMLRWRAISECVRMACPEVLGGLKYTPEETIEFTGSPAPQQQAAPVQQQEDRTDFYALLEGCQSRDDLNAVAGKISAAGRMNEFRGTLNEFWKTLAPAEQQDEEVVDGTLIDETTGEIHDNAA
ncbi:MAG: recombinase RecT [Brevibacterium aurantiacum]|nr:recombinase RecT [Brevibacterium aurantiacum]